MGKKLKIEKSRKRKKWQLIKYTDSILEKDMIAGPHIELFGNSKIVIDGCRGVFEYKDTYIKLRLTQGMLILCGIDFDVISFEERLITIRGKISSIEFCV